MTAPDLLAFVATAPGLEPLAAAELDALGIREIHPEPGGIAVRASLPDIWRMNLHLRTASRVLVRVGEFAATAFWQLEKRAAKLPWERFLAPGAAVEIRATCQKSRLYHQQGVAERVRDAADRAVGGLGAADVASTEEDEDGQKSGIQRIFVRIVQDHVLVSVCASGDLLHRRGWRQALSRAPLRETLAAALLQAAGWSGDRPLLDPLCGSGTLPIEAALLARRLAPGLGRAFAFTGWPDFDPAAWEALRDRAREAALPRCPVPLRGSDRDADALSAARSNAARAGVTDDIAWVQADLQALRPPEGWGPGLLVANPPYGRRLEGPRWVGATWGLLGRVCRERLPAWGVAVLSPDRRLDAALALPVRQALHTRNGGIPIRYLVSSPRG